MQLVVKNRASAILYNILRSQHNKAKWILPANCCPIVPLVFKKANVSFDLIDINNYNLCLNEDEFWKKMEKNSSAYNGIVYIDTYGFESTVAPFFSEIKSRYPDFTIIHDKCLSIPSLGNDANANATLYSTGHSKYTDLKKGGYAIINNFTYAEFGPIPYHYDDLTDLEKKYKSSFESRLELKYENTNWLDMQSLNVSDKSYLDEIERNKELVRVHKKKINEIYVNSIPVEIQFKDEFQNWRFNILINGKTDLLKTIFENNLFASSHYQSLGDLFGAVNFPATDFVFSNIINLFNDFNFSEMLAEKICKLIQRHYSNYGVNNSMINLAMKSNG